MLSSCSHEMFKLLLFFFFLVCFVCRGQQPEQRRIWEASSRNSSCHSARPAASKMPSLYEAMGAAMRPRPEQQPKASSESRSAPRTCSSLARMMTLAIAATSACQGLGGPLNFTGAWNSGGGWQPGPEFPRMKLKARRSYNRENLLKLAEEATTFKVGAKHNDRTWQMSFLIEKHGPMDPRVWEDKRLELRAALKLVGADGKVKCDAAQVKKAGGAINATSGARRVVKRTRKHKWHDRKSQAGELEVELFQWFADRLATNKTRVFANEIHAQAQLYKDAILEDFKQRCDDGHADPAKPPIIPDVQSIHFLRRWRYRFNVTARTVNLRYKIPRATFLSRLKTFWSNAIIVRKLYELLHPGQQLDFVGFDQKPLWFNQIAAEKTFSMMGRAKVGVAENVSASRARFTAMTQCKTWLDGWRRLCGGQQPDAASQPDIEPSLECPGYDQQPDQSDALQLDAMEQEQNGQPPAVPAAGANLLRGAGLPPAIAVLFKIGDAACSVDNLRNSLETGPRTFLQGSPSGSYKLHHVLEFLEWAVQPASELGRSICVVLDWFAPHLHASVDTLLHSMGHIVLRIGGGLTPAVQVEDTHAHRPYNNHFRKLEGADAKRAWDLRPGSLLECSKQTILTRAEDAWNLVDHAKCVEGWSHDGITNPLDADASEHLGSHVLAYWTELEMDTVRAQLVKDVTDAVTSGEITRFDQYHELLLEYDDHAPIVEGMEGAPVYVYDEGGAHDPIGDNGENLADPDEGPAEAVAKPEDEVMTAIQLEALTLEGDQQPMPTPGSASSSSSQNAGQQPGSASAHSPFSIAPGVGQQPGPGFPLSSASQAAPAATPPVPLPAAPPPPPPDVAFGAWQLADPPGEAPGSPTRAQMAQAFVDAAATMRAVGKKPLADLIDGQAERHLRARDRANPGTTKVLKAATEKKRQRIAEERGEESAKRQRMAEKALELKIATEQRLAASATSKEKQAIAKAAGLETKATMQAASLEAKASAAAAKDLEAAAKKAKEDEKKVQQAAAQLREHRRRHFAGELADKLSRYMCHATHKAERTTKLRDFTKSLVGKVPWKKVGPTPEFWDPKDRRGLMSISPVTHAGTIAHSDPQKIFASESFSWQLWGKQLPQGPGLNRLRAFIETVLPGFNRTIGPRWPVEDILKANAWNADITFVTAVYYYSCLVPNDLLPCGLRAWPPPAA